MIAYLQRTVRKDGAIVVCAASVVAAGLSDPGQSDLRPLAVQPASSQPNLCQPNLCQPKQPARSQSSSEGASLPWLGDRTNSSGNDIRDVRFMRRIDLGITQSNILWLDRNRPQDAQASARDSSRKE